MEGKSALQHKLAVLLKEKRPASKLVSELMELLDISRASVYKRLKGEILLNTVELETIIQHFEINTYQLFTKRENMVSMFIPEKAKDGDPILHFLRPIRDQILAIAQQNNAVITFLAVSFPVFYSFLYPELAIFKFYVYRNSVWQPTHAKIPPLAIAHMSRNQEYMNLFADIRNAFGHINSVEVWTGDFYQSTINELKFYLECELFTDPNEALVVMDALAKTIENISTMVMAGNKSVMCRNPERNEGAELDLYYNDSGHFGSTIIADSEKIKLVYLTYDQPNYLVSGDPLLFTDTKTWTGKVVKKSSPISKLGTLDQVKYFNNIREKMKLERAKLEELIK